jgi:hypothetical protein
MLAGLIAVISSTPEPRREAAQESTQRRQPWVALSGEDKDPKGGRNKPQEHIYVESRS